MFNLLTRSLKYAPESIQVKIIETLPYDTMEEFMIKEVEGIYHGSLRFTCRGANFDFASIGTSSQQVLSDLYTRATEELREWESVYY